MKFALTGVGSGSTARPEILVQVAQKAETLGFESVWIPEHLAVPVEITSRYPYSADGKFWQGAALQIPVALGLSRRVRKNWHRGLSFRYAIPGGR
jgi:alkanesulfonate monooxygenase SsuD/methylene tetrahydromethanopterin reductase-like flavin-dependent oxidoreductase (luciferase family)